LVYAHLGLNVADKGAIESYLKAQFDAETGLFGGSIRTTAYALHIFDLLGAGAREHVQKAHTALNAYLTKSVKAGQESFFQFSREANLDEFTANYYGIMAGSFSGFTFAEPASWGRYYAARQNTKTGGFANVEGNVAYTAHAVSALWYLQKTTKTRGFVSQHVDEKAILRNAVNIPHGLIQAAYAHTAVSRTSQFQELFSKKVTYDVAGTPAEDILVQGSQVRPSLTLVAHFGLPHPGMNVEVSIEHKGEEKKMKLGYNVETGSYVADETYDTSDKLGATTFLFYVRVNLPGEVVDFGVREEKRIGFNLKVKTTATLAGKDVEPNGIIGVGAQFSFALSLSTQSKSKITEGDFDVVFAVVDSSNVVIHTETKPGSAGGFKFDFELAQSNIPAGVVGMRFQVKNADGIHTEQIISYQLATSMVASAVKFENAKNSREYNLGDVISVTMQPGSLPDLRTVHYYAAKDAAGADAGEARAFYLDLFAGEELVRSYKGKSSADNAGNVVYRFDITVTNTFDAIGKHHVAFRYQPIKGAAVTLSAYDVEHEELIDDQNALSYTVKADLVVADLVGAPTEGTLTYGSTVSFTFTVTDALTNKNVWPASGVDEADIFLVLRNTDAKGKSVESARTAATVSLNENGDATGLSINWDVSANAVQGKGTLELVAGAEELALLNKATKKPFKVAVNIGGEIVVTPTVHTYSTIDAFHNGFVAQFELSCEGKLLKGAALRGVVKYANEDEEVLSGPVARDDDVGIYAVSFTGSDLTVKAGKYVVDIYREADQSSKPLASVSVDVETGASAFLPFRTETLVMMVIVSSFFYFSFKKLQIEKK
jgi:hypothetical protein